MGPHFLWKEEAKVTNTFINRNLHSSDMNGLVQKALDASNVYENIANYVSEANETAELALNITDRIYDVSVPLPQGLLVYGLILLWLFFSFFFFINRFLWSFLIFMQKTSLCLALICYCTSFSLFTKQSPSAFMCVCVCMC